MSPDAVWVAAAAAAFAGTVLAAPRLLELQARAGWLRPAFDASPLPAAGGLAVVLGLLAAAPLLPAGEGRRVLVAVLAAALWGLADDMWGTAGERGWASHLRGLLAGRWTSGSLKIVGIGLGGWAAAGGALGAAAVALTANLVNVLDVRPGRAVKGYLLLAVVLAGLGAAGPGLVLMAAGLAWFPFDAGRRGMLGDAGANALGAAAGIVAAGTLDPPGLLAWLLGAAALQALADRRSLTAVIQRIPPLRWLDGLGVVEGTFPCGPNSQ